MNKNVLITISSDEEGDNTTSQRNPKPKVSVKRLQVKPFKKFPDKNKDFVNTSGWLRKTLEKRRDITVVKRTKPTPEICIVDGDERGFTFKKSKKSEGDKGTPEIVVLDGESAEENSTIMPTIVNVKSIATGFNSTSSKRHRSYNENIYEDVEEGSKPSRSSTTLFPLNTSTKRQNEETSKQAIENVEVGSADKGTFKNPFSQNDSVTSYETKGDPVLANGPDEDRNITSMFINQLHGRTPTKKADVLNSLNNILPKICGTALIVPVSKDVDNDKVSEVNKLTNNCEQESRRSTGEEKEIVVEDDASSSVIKDLANVGKPKELQPCDDEKGNNQNGNKGSGTEICDGNSSIKVNRGEGNAANSDSATLKLREHDSIDTGAKPKSVTKNNDIMDSSNVPDNLHEGSEVPGGNKTTSEMFKEFISMLSSVEKKEEDRNKIIQKLNKHYNAANPKYVQSEGFQSLLEKSITELKKEKLMVYFLIRDIVENLKSRKVLKDVKKKVPLTSVPRKADTKNEDKDIIVDEEEPEQNEIQDNVDINSRKEKAIRKLSRTLRLLHKKIRKLEESEVDLDDECDSTYFQTARYKDRLCKVYRKYCEYTGESADAGRATGRRIPFNGTKYPAVNRCIEKFLNKTRRFPDFVDILKLLQDQSSTLGLNTTPEGIRAIAMEAFREAGQLLQRMRVFDLWDSFNVHIDNEMDPAKTDPELERILAENYEKSVIREREIIEFYAEKQNNENLEPVEVPDEEANNSPVESEDEDDKEIEAYENEIAQDLEDRSEDEERRKDEKVKEVDEGDDNAPVNDVQTKESINGEGQQEAPDIQQDGEHNHVTSDVDTTMGKAKPSTPVKQQPEKQDFATPQRKESKNNFKNCKSIKWRKDLSDSEAKAKENGTVSCTKEKTVSENELSTSTTEKSLENKNTTAECNLPEKKTEGKDDPVRDSHVTEDKLNEKVETKSGSVTTEGDCMQDEESKKNTNLEEKEHVEKKIESGATEASKETSEKQNSDDELSDDFIPGSQEEGGRGEKENFIQKSVKRKMLFEDVCSPPAKRTSNANLKSNDDLTKTAGGVDKESDISIARNENKTCENEVKQTVFHVNYVQVKHNAKGFLHNYYSISDKCYSSTTNLAFKMKPRSRQKKAFEDLTNLYTTYGKGESFRTRPVLSPSKSILNSRTPVKKNIREIKSKNMICYREDVPKIELTKKSRKILSMGKPYRSYSNIRNSSIFYLNNHEKETKQCTLDNDNENVPNQEGGNGEEKSREGSRESCRDISNQENKESGDKLGNASSGDGDNNDNNNGGSRHSDQDDENDESEENEKEEKDGEEEENESKEEEAQNSSEVVDESDNSSSHDNAAEESSNNQDCEDDADGKSEEETEKVASDGDRENAADSVDENSFSAEHIQEGEESNEICKETDDNGVESNKDQESTKADGEASDGTESDKMEGADEAAVGDDGDENQQALEGEHSHEESDEEMKPIKDELAESESEEFNKTTDVESNDEEEEEEEKHDNEDETAAPESPVASSSNMPSAEEGENEEEGSCHGDKDGDRNVNVNVNVNVKSEDERELSESSEEKASRTSPDEVEKASDEEKTSSKETEEEQKGTIKEEIKEEIKAEDEEKLVENEENTAEPACDTTVTKEEDGSSTGLTEENKEAVKEDSNIENGDREPLSQQTEEPCEAECSRRDSDNEQEAINLSDNESTSAKETKLKTTVTCESVGKASKLRQSITAFRNRDGVTTEVEVIVEKKKKHDASDEEIVKKFLQHSPSSISITRPRKPTTSKPPSEEALQALATLRRLKNISTTRVQRSAKRSNEEDVVVLSETMTAKRRPPAMPARTRTNAYANQSALPVISSVQSINSRLTPKIVTVQGNVSGFNNRIPQFPRYSSRVPPFPGYFRMPVQQPPLRISNVRGNLSNNFSPSPMQPRLFRGQSSSLRQSLPQSSSAPRGKNKKTVECVVLD